MQMTIMNKREAAEDARSIRAKMATAYSISVRCVARQLNLLMSKKRGGPIALRRSIQFFRMRSRKFSMRFYALSDLEIVQGRLVRRYCNNLTEALGLLKQQPEATMRTFSSIMEVLEYSFEYSFDDEEQYQEGRKKIHEYYVVYGVEISPDHLVKRVYDNLAKARDVLQQHSEGKIKIFADKQAAFDFYRKGSEVTF